MTLGTFPILHADSSKGGFRLVLFLGASETVLSSALEPGDIHSILLCYTGGSRAMLGWIQHKLDGSVHPFGL